MARSLLTPRPTSRLLLVSNRLPVTVKHSEQGEYEFTNGTGGLVSGLRGLSKTTTFHWYGWPGIEVAEKDTESLTSQLKETYGAVPVFLDDGLADLYYNGFSSELENTYSSPVKADRNG